MLSYVALVHAFVHFFHLDQANARIHMAPKVKYSPITFGLASLIAGLGARYCLEEVDGAEAAFETVMADRGAYELDAGR